MYTIFVAKRKFFGEGGCAGDMRGMGEGYRLDLSGYSVAKKHCSFLNVFICIF